MSPSRSICSDGVRRRTTMTSDNNNPNPERRIVFIRPIGDRRFKQWVKTVERVDTTVSNGYAFEGSFIRFDRKAELPVGTFLLYFGMEGSRRFQRPCVALKEVTPDGRLETIYERDGLDLAWALDVRDDIAAIIAARRSSSSADGAIAAAAGDAAGSVDGAANPLRDAADPVGDVRRRVQRLALDAADAAAAAADTPCPCRRRRIIAERDEDEAAGRVDGEDSP
jgi:hypothetical protein